VADLRERVRFAVDSGVRPERIVIDPAPMRGSPELVRGLDEVVSIGYPTLVSGMDSIDDRPPHEGAIAANVIAVLAGARILRVRDVPATVAAVRMTEAMLGWRPPLAPRHNLG
jgi:dihydropteroate synthase